MTNDAWPWIYNVSIIACIAICTISVAYFARSPDGLWSMLMLFALASRSECACEDEEEAVEEQPKAA